MPPHLTDDDVRAEYVRAMGLELGNLCHELQTDLAWLDQKWLEFGELFQQGQRRIDLLNATDLPPIIRHG